MPVKTIDIPGAVLNGDQITRLSKFGKIYLFDTIGSTQTYAKKLARSVFKPDVDSEDSIHLRAVVIANKQTAGLGRHGANWFSSEQGLQFSILLAYPKKYKAISIWTLLTAKIIAETIEQLHKVPIFIKWPNDLVCLQSGTNAFRKIGGVLSETKSSSSLFHSVGSYSNIIFGIGININQNTFPPELVQTTSLKQELIQLRNMDEELNRGEILYKIIENIAKNLLTYKTFAQDSTDSTLNIGVLDDIKQRSIVIGKKVFVARRMRSISGTVLDIDEQGRLVIRTDSSRIVVIDSGQINKINNI
jgi:BirA family biotin operon repressor/biotin-[acetyl-CoA-carboxylase] ligase